MGQIYTNFFFPYTKLVSWGKLLIQFQRDRNGVVTGTVENTSNYKQLIIMLYGKLMQPTERFGITTTLI